MRVRAMRTKTTLLLAATAGLVAAAQPHHNHQHFHQPQPAKRGPHPVIDVISVPGPTLIVFELNGHQISEADVEQGIKNGSLVLPAGATLPPPELVAPLTTLGQSLAALATSTPAPEPSATTTETIDVAEATTSTSTTPIAVPTSARPPGSPLPPSTMRVSRLWPTARRRSGFRRHGPKLWAPDAGARGRPCPRKLRTPSRPARSDGTIVESRPDAFLCWLD